MRAVEFGHLPTGARLADDPELDEAWEKAGRADSEILTGPLIATGL